MPDTPLSEPLLDRKAAAKLLNVSPGTLAVWDSTKRYDLQPLRAGNRVRYRRSVLLEFLSRQVRPAYDRQPEQSRKETALEHPSCKCHLHETTPATVGFHSLSDKE